jgi:hypothetical protein
VAQTRCRESFPSSFADREVGEGEEEEEEEER